jgi:hypothetical protein
MVERPHPGGVITARGIVSMFARECWISDDDIEIDIRLFDLELLRFRKLETGHALLG